MRVTAGGSPAALRERNRRLMIERLLQAPDGMTRQQLAQALQLTVPAVAALVQGKESLAAIVAEARADPRDKRAGSTGPAPNILRIKPTLGYVVGMYLSHSQVHVAIANLQASYVSAPQPGQEDAPHHAMWNVEGDLHGALSWATKAAARLVEAQRIRPAEVAAIGLAISAPVKVPDATEARERRVRMRIDLGGEAQWLNVDPLAALANHLAALDDGEAWSDVPLYVDNGSNLGALAELKAGAGRGHANILYVSVDERGVGAGLVFDGRLYRGAGGLAGELGHVVLESTGPTCTRCGRTCVEAKLLEILREGPAATLEQLVSGALDANQDSARSEAVRVIHRAADHIGRAIAGFATFLNFDRIIIGGPFPKQAYGLVIPRIQEALAKLVIAPAMKDYVVELGALEQHAMLDGAVWLALERERVDYLLALADRGAQPPRDDGADDVAPPREVEATTPPDAERTGGAGG